MHLDLTLRPVGRNVKLGKDVRRGVKADNEGLKGVVAVTVITILVILETSNQVQDPARE